MIQKTDWHIHTTASDGLWSPKKVLEEAYEKDLVQIAITDHDTLNGWFNLEKEEDLPDIFVSPAVEFGVDISDWGSSEGKDEVHILAYGVNPESDELNDYLDKVQSSRKNRFNMMLDKAIDYNFELDLKKIDAIRSTDTQPGRLHLARLLVESGHFQSISEAFERFLNVGQPGYIPRFRYGLQDLCSLIKRSNGIAVLAHPCQITSLGLRKGLVQSEILDGIEVFHPSHGASEMEHLLSECRLRGKMATGGSDFHGLSGRFPEGLGIFYPPFDDVREFICWILESPYGRMMAD